MKEKLMESIFSADRNEAMNELESNAQGEFHSALKGQQPAEDHVSKSNGDGATSPYGAYLRDSYKQKEASAKETLRANLGNDIVFTGTWADTTIEERELEEEELLESEVSASVFMIGCYTVRMAYCLYIDDRSRNAPYTERISAGKEEITAYRKEEKRIEQELEDTGIVIAELCPIGKGVRMVTEVSAIYGTGSDTAVDSWQNICMAAPDHEGSESIEYVCTVKKDDKTPDGQAALFILKHSERSPDPVEIWYKFTPNGKVERYSLDDSNAADWKL